MCLFISLPGCCVFSGKDDWLVDVLLRVEDLAPPVARTRTAIFNTKNNKDLAPPVARMITTISTTTTKESRILHHLTRTRTTIFNTSNNKKQQWKQKKNKISSSDLHHLPLPSCFKIVYNATSRRQPQ